MQEDSIRHAPHLQQLISSLVAREIRKAVSLISHHTHHQPPPQHAPPHAPPHGTTTRTTPPYGTPHNAPIIRSRYSTCSTTATAGRPSVCTRRNDVIKREGAKRTIASQRIISGRRRRMLSTSSTFDIDILLRYGM